MINHENSDSDNDSNYDNENEHNSDFNLNYVNDENRDTHDDCDVELKEIRSFLYRHFIISIVVNETRKKSNLVFMMIILLHIKQEDNNSRM